METQAKVYQQRNDEIDFPAIIRALVRNWWVILLCGLIAGMWAYMGVNMLKTPVYVSQATLIISNNGNDTSVYTDSAVEKVANQYQKILSSTVLKNTVQEELGVKNLPGSISASVVPGTNLLVVQGQASKPGDAYLLVKSAVANYSKVSDYVISSFVLEVMKEASIPTVPSNQGVAVTWAMRALLLGWAAAALLIGMLTFLRDDVKNERQVDNLLDTTLFSSIYYEKKKRGKNKSSILINSPVTSFFYSENIRKMATKLDYRAGKNNQKVILITSVMENEGKSTVAANLALALVNRNKRVLLIDGDLRKPSLYKIFDKEITGEMEIGACLAEKTDMQNVLTKDKDTGLYYIFGTKSYRNSDALLSSKRMRDIIRAARKVMDYVIIDSSPVNITSDAELVAEQVDGVLMVVRQCAARVADINDSLDTFKKTRAEVMGCVLNAIQTRFLPKSAEYGYNYGYGYSRLYGKYGKYGRYGKYDKKPATEEIKAEE